MEFKAKILTALAIAGVLIASGSAHGQQRCYSSIQSTSPTTEFINNDDGTVTHLRTGLMWKRCLEGLTGTQCEVGEAQDRDWRDALKQALESTFAGYTDWRLPNIKELASIIEHGCDSPAINLEIFPNATVGWLVWSSSPGRSSSAAWGVDFDSGDTQTDVRYQDWYRHVRLVRVAEFPTN